MYDIGRICIKIAGRDSGMKCVVVEQLKGPYVLIDGQTRRRKCNISHLEPTAQTIAIQSKADHATIVAAFKKMNIVLVDRKSKKVAKRPIRRRKAPAKKAPATAPSPKAAPKKTEKK